MFNVNPASSASTLQSSAPATPRSLLLPLISLLLLTFSTGAVADAGVSSRPCTARWAMLGSHRNRADGSSFQVRLSFTSGPKLPAPMRQASQGDDNQDGTKTLVGLTVRLATAGSNQQGGFPPTTELTVQLTGSEVTQTVERSLTVTVPASERGAVTVWQLVAATQGDSGQFGFENTAVTTGGLEPPSQVVACTASYRTRPLIREDTLVRLRHVPTGKYLVMTQKRGWEAATLGYSRVYRYRLIGIGFGGAVRIEAETHTYGGYRYAYSSLRGGVYFDTSRPDSDAQQWILSNPYPRDGDQVSIRSARWRSAALTQRRGSITNVYCLNTQSPDLWIIEVASG